MPPPIPAEAACPFLAAAHAGTSEAHPTSAAAAPTLDVNVETIVLKSPPPIDLPNVDPEAAKKTRRRETAEEPTRIVSPWNIEGILERPAVDPVAPTPRPEAWENRRARPATVDAAWPAPTRPLNGPIILGSLALVTVILLPLAAAFESSRVFGVLGFCLCGFFLPFSPIAWIAGLAAEQRRRDQRLRPERRVVLGRLLGQWATLALIAEGTIGLLLVAALRLGGKFPATFWAS